MTRTTNPEYEQALKLWTTHRQGCRDCVCKNYCTDGQVLRIAALKIVSSAWQDAT